MLVDELLVLLQHGNGLSLLLRVVVNYVLQLFLVRRQLSGFRLGNLVAATAALDASQLGWQEPGVLGWSRDRRLGEHDALTAGSLGAPQAAARVDRARSATLAVAPESLRVVKLHAPDRRGLQQAAFGQVGDADLIANLDVLAASQDVVGGVVVPHGVGETRVRHERGEKVGRITLWIVRVLEAVQDPNLDQALNDVCVRTRRDLFDNVLGRL
mmetsp:Transcript_50226/g.144794  ORF Transcript_50226/g.144794 Transcript_50226/m.144794 type:complete len:213 (+) Transcript_50226:499-1137(+)